MSDAVPPPLGAPDDADVAPGPVADGPDPQPARSPDERRDPLWREAVAALGCVALAIGGAVLALVAYAVATTKSLGTWPDVPRLALALSQGVGLLLPALAMLAVARATGLDRPPRAPRRVSPSTAVSVAVFTFSTAVLVGIAWASAVALRAPRWLEQAQDQLVVLYGPLFDVSAPWDVVAILMALSIVPAVCEEVLFRGFVQGVLRARLTPGWSIAITSTVFAAFHLDWVGFPTRVVIGVALGVAYERTGSLRLSMLVHALHNLMTMLVMPWDVTAALAVPSRTEAWVGLALALPGCLVAGWLWWRALAALPRPERA